MRLYHGSNVSVKTLRLLTTRRQLDFGPGFYLTSSLEQAEKWALRTSAIRNSGKPTVSSFDFDLKKAMKHLSTLTFPGPDRSWLRYVVANRLEQPHTPDYDLVCGPVANDQTLRVLNDFMNGYLTENIALQLLLPQRLKDQFAFKTDRALRWLHFQEALPCP